MNNQTDDILTLRLTLKRWFKKRTIEITPERFIWGDESISSERITGIRFGIDSGGANSILAVRDVAGNVVTTDWLSGNDFPTVVASVIGLYAPRILSNLVNTINGGKSVHMGDAAADKSGITIQYRQGDGCLSSAWQSIRWNRAIAKMVAGHVKLSGTFGSFDLMTGPSSGQGLVLSFRDVWNAFLIPDLIQIMRPAAQAAEERSERDHAQQMREEGMKLWSGANTKEEWDLAEQIRNNNMEKYLQSLKFRQSLKH